MAKRRLGHRLVESMREIVEIEAGRARAPMRRFRSLPETSVTPPPRYNASRVQKLREALGLSQPVFAKALNVSVATVRGWEQGARIPDGPSRRLLDLAERHPKVILGTLRRVG